MNTVRGTGRTATQMWNAPVGAVFVWVHYGSIDYAKNLAEYLGRGDIKVVSPSWLEDSRWLGLRAPCIIVDHAAELNSRQWDGWYKGNEYLDARK